MNMVYRNLSIALSLLLLFSLTTVAAPALLMTNTGKTAEGSLAGISPVIRLSVPHSASWFGPPPVFDIPLSTVRQITVDFPRLIVETNERVYLGPFSAFTGILEHLALRTKDETLNFPIASLRAIALHGNPLGSVPREWLGNEFLLKPEVLTAQALQAEESETLPEEPSERIYWEELYPTLPPESTQETSWLLNMLIVAGLAALLYFSLSSSEG